MPDAPTPLDLDGDGSPFTPDDVELCRARTVTMHANPAPAWDEEAARAASQVLYERLTRIPEFARLDSHVRSDYSNMLARAALAVVREHLPVKPDRETVARAIDPGAWRDEPTPERPHSATDEEWGRIWDRVRTESKAPSLARADAVLDLWPGESRATVQAEALHDAADEYEARLPDGTGNGRAYNSYTVAAMLRARADRLRPKEK